MKKTLSFFMSKFLLIIIAFVLHISTNAQINNTTNQTRETLNKEE
jgi:hypothetical protein